MSDNMIEKKITIQTKDGVIKKIDILVEQDIREKINKAVDIEVSKMLEQYFSNDQALQRILKRSFFEVLKDKIRKKPDINNEKLEIKKWEDMNSKIKNNIV